MASLESARTRAILARGVVGQVSDDLGVALRLVYSGTGSVTSVTVTTATNIVLITSDGGTDTYAFATYTTMGALVDAINADGIFQARLLDTLRSKATASTLINGAVTISSLGNYDVLSDTSGANYLAFRLTWDRSADVNVKLRMQHRIALQEIVTNVTLGGGADSNGLKIYEVNPIGQVETLIYQKTPTSGSAATTNWALGFGKITAQDGNDLVVLVEDATSVTGSLTVSGIAE